MKLEFLGNRAYGGWMTNTEGLSEKSVVYSFGVGFDISWDKAMIERFGCQIYAFDPAQSSVDWLRNENPPAEFIFEQIGLSSHDGEEIFYLPLKPGKSDYSTLKKGSRSTTFRVKKLETLMKERGHKSIDVLKLDIEGSEFSVIPSVAKLPVQQILVEIHDFFYQEGWKGFRRIYGWLKLQKLLFVLKWYGFSCVNRSDHDYTFIRR